MSGMEQHEPDDLDRLFTATPAPVPVDVGGRARARLRALRGARRLTLLAAVDAAVLLLLGALSFVLGEEIARSDAPLLVRLAVEDRSLAASMPGDLLAALRAGLPWPHLFVTFAAALTLALLTTYLIRATAALPPEAVRTRR
jgi:hypothetical protein